MIHDFFDFIRYVLYGVSEHPLDTTAFFIKCGYIYICRFASLSFICIISPGRALMSIRMVYLNQTSHS